MYIFVICICYYIHIIFLIKSQTLFLLSLTIVFDYFPNVVEVRNLLLLSFLIIVIILFLYYQQ